MEVKDKRTVPNEQVAKPPSKIGSWFLALYNVYRFLGRFFREVFLPPYEFKEVMRQCYEIGLQVCLTDFYHWVHHRTGFH